VTKAKNEASAELLVRIDVALTQIREKELQWEARPIKGSLERRAPGCERGCCPCFTECAAIPHRLAWWEGELQRLGGVPKERLLRDGIDRL
jgi:hypothetical protein